MGGEGEASRLEWTAAGPAGPAVEGRTRGDVRRLESLDNAALVVPRGGNGCRFEEFCFTLRLVIRTLGTLLDF